MEGEWKRGAPCGIIAPRRNTKERSRNKDGRINGAKWRRTLRRISSKAKWNDRTVPSLCLPSAPEPAGKKTRLDARFAVCTTVRGFILIRRTAGTVCSVSCQLQAVSEWQLHSSRFTNTPGPLAGPRFIAPRGMPFFLAPSVTRYTARHFYPKFLPNSPRDKGPAFSNYYL